MEQYSDKNPTFKDCKVSRTSDQVSIREPTFKEQSSKFYLGRADTFYLSSIFTKFSQFAEFQGLWFCLMKRIFNPDFTGPLIRNGIKSRLLALQKLRRTFIWFYELLRPVRIGSLI